MRACDKCNGTGQIPDDRRLGREMREMRQAAGITARKVAKAMGISPAHLSDMEHGRRRWMPRLVIAFTIAVDPDAPKEEMTMNSYCTRNDNEHSVCNCQCNRQQNARRGMRDEIRDLHIEANKLRYRLDEVTEERDALKKENGTFREILDQDQETTDEYDAMEARLQEVTAERDELRAELC